MTGGGARPDARRLKSIFGGSVGNLVEWYDWYVYSAFALYFAKSFFPPGSQTAQLLNTAAVFALGFLMRPVGGWILGRYADRHGRRAALSLSVLLMCAGSLLIAVTPSYSTIGVAAPLLLVLARLLQGLSVGGEYGASATYLSEMAGRQIACPRCSTSITIPVPAQLEAPPPVASDTSSAIQPVAAPAVPARQRRVPLIAAAVILLATLVQFKFSGWVYYEGEVKN